jgi:hypothetical protein
VPETPRYVGDVKAGELTEITSQEYWNTKLGLGNRLWRRENYVRVQTGPRPDLLDNTIAFMGSWVQASAIVDAINYLRSLAYVETKRRPRRSKHDGPCIATCAYWERAEFADEITTRWEPRDDNRIYLRGVTYGYIGFTDKNVSHLAICDALNYVKDLASD